MDEAHLPITITSQNSCEQEIYLSFYRTLRFCILFIMRLVCNTSIVHLQCSGSKHWQILILISNFFTLSSSFILILLGKSQGIALKMKQAITSRKSQEEQEREQSEGFETVFCYPHETSKDDLKRPVMILGHLLSFYRHNILLFNHCLRKAKRK